MRTFELNSLIKFRYFLDDKSEQFRNIFYQKQTANEIESTADEIISLVTSSLNIHLNINQQYLLNSSQIYFHLQKLTIQSLQNQIPMKFNQTNDSSLLLRVCLTFQIRKRTNSIAF